MSPKISVLMPVRNGEQFLHEALMSVREQTLADWELVAVVDATDNTWRILESFGDDRIRIFESPRPGGLVRQLNLGLLNCHGDYVARFDADDVCEPQRLKVQVAHMDRNPALGAVGGGALLINEHSRLIGRHHVVSGPRHVARRLLWKNALLHPSVMFRRQLILDLGGYHDVAHSEDYELWLRIAACADVDNIDIPLIRHRSHRGQTSRGFRLREIRTGAILRARIHAAQRAGVSPAGALLRHTIWLAAVARHGI
ncbi:MAG: glycosyltransferase [Candidatus Dormibacteria bacterium]